MALVGDADHKLIRCENHITVSLGRWRIENLLART